MTADLEKLVKPLEWTKHPKVDGWRCDTLVGTYKVFGIGPTPSWDFDGSNGEARSCVSETVEAAKAAAQADYARRIAAALDPDAVAKMVQDAVEAEREACANVVENHLHDWASDLDATRHELMDAQETGVFNGRRVRNRDWLKSEAIGFKERAEAVAESVDHTVAAIRARAEA